MPDGSLINTFLAMMVMVGIFGAILLVVKRFALKGKNINNGASIQIISKTNLQPKTSIFVIKTGDRTLLIGVTDHNISTLADLTEGSQNNIPINAQKTNQQKIIQNKINHNTIPTDYEDLSFGAFLKNAFRRNPN